MWLGRERREMLGSSVLNIKQSLLSMAFCCSKALASLIVVSLLLYCTSDMEHLGMRKAALLP